MYGVIYIILYNYIIISSASGELFAVGAFNTLRLCDKTGVRCIREVTFHVYKNLYTTAACKGDKNLRVHEMYIRFGSSVLST